MYWHSAKPPEIALIEQIETLLKDKILSDNERLQIGIQLWQQLEQIHGKRILQIVSPEGRIISAPPKDGQS